MSIYSITTEGEVALSAATLKGVIGLVGSAAVRPQIIEWGISFDGVSSIAEPAYVRLIRGTTAGTATTLTEVRWDASNLTAPIAYGQKAYTVEPTKGDILAMYEIHTQGGSLVIQYPLGREPSVTVAANAQILIDVTSPATVNCVAYMVWEE